MRTLVAAAEPQWDSEEILALFPDERRPALIPSIPEVGRLSGLYAPLYRTLIAAVAARGASRLGLPEAPLRIPAREALVPVVHAYLGRALRLDRVLRGISPRDVRVPRAEPFPRPRDMLEFTSLCAVSFEFNQELVRRLAGLWGIADEGKVSAAELAVPKPFANRNFQDAGLGVKLRRKAFQAVGKLLRGLGVGRPIPTLSMAYHTDALRDNGFYFLLLERVQGRLGIGRPSFDSGLRETEIARSVREQGPAIKEFLKGAGFSETAPEEKIIFDLGSFAADYYPAAYLEGLADNLRAGAELLRPYHPRPLLVGEVNSEEATLLMAAAKLNGQEVIGVQHGGYSGYIDDHIGAVEYEYPYLDRFLSWGWSEMPTGEACREVKVTPLPSPWLGERARWWAGVLPARRRDPRGKDHDFLLMTSRIYRFDPAPSGQWVFRADSIQDYACFLEELVRACERRGVRLLHKTYNDRSRRAMSRCLEGLAGGAAYRLLETADKGLAPEILASCSVVLWDQPGTGFLECLAAGIPSMVLWPRLYNREEPRRRPLFEALERAGLVHSGAEGLLDELGRFKAGPGAWMQDPGRRAAAERFTCELGWSDPDWARLWRDFLKKEAYRTR